MTVLKHIIVGGVPYDLAGAPGSITTEMLEDESVTQEKLSPDIDLSNPLDSYPVGSVYISYEPTSPAELFGGTWLEMTGVFPYFNHGTGTGGSNTHTLTIDEIPGHKHDFPITSGKGDQAFIYFGNGQNYVNYETRSTGGGNFHNNMPAYQSFYAWRRTE